VVYFAPNYSYISKMSGIIFETQCIDNYAKHNSKILQYRTELQAHVVHETPHGVKF